MEDDPATEADHRRTLAINILHVVDIFGCLHTFFFHPGLDSFPKTGHIDQARNRAQSGDGFLNPRLILC